MQFKLGDYLRAHYSNFITGDPKEVSHLTCSIVVHLVQHLPKEILCSDGTVLIDLIRHRQSIYEHTYIIYVFI